MPLNIAQIGDLDRCHRCLTDQILISYPESHHTSFNNLRWKGFSHLGGAQNNHLQKYCTNHKTYHHHKLKHSNSPFEGVSHLRRAQWSLVWPSAAHHPPPGRESTLFIWTSVPSLSYTSSSSGNHQATFLQVLSFCCSCFHTRATSKRLVQSNFILYPAKLHLDKIYAIHIFLFANLFTKYTTFAKSHLL